MRSQHEFLRQMIEFLRAAGVDHMVVGSTAASFHGRPRASQDVDVVIDARASQVADFVRLCVAQGYYADLADAEEAVRLRSLFNVIDTTSGHKLDLIVRKDRPYSQVEFARRTDAMLGDLSAHVATPEDVILTKLEWALGSRSERQYQDALGVALVQGESLDVDYLRKWAGTLGVAADLERLLRDRKAT